jgi:hypothetical protein
VCRGNNATQREYEGRKAMRLLKKRKKEGQGNKGKCALGFQEVL